MCPCHRHRQNAALLTVALWSRVDIRGHRLELEP
jgi:hypothetical protein